jgi:hypothetical protein
MMVAKRAAILARWVLCGLQGKKRAIRGSRPKEHQMALPERTFGLGETLATTLVGLVSKIAAKIRAYTHAIVVYRMLNRPQGRIKELWA